MRANVIQIRSRNHSRHVLHAVVFLLCAAVTGCRSEQRSKRIPSERPAVTFVGIQQVMEPLETFYRARLPEIAFSLKQGSSGMLANVDYLQSGAADVTFTQSDIAYTALTKGTEANPVPHTNLRGTAVTFAVGPRRRCREFVGLQCRGRRQLSPECRPASTTIDFDGRDLGFESSTRRTECAACASSSRSRSERYRWRRWRRSRMGVLETADDTSHQRTEQHSARRCRTHVSRPDDQ